MAFANLSWVTYRKQSNIHTKKPNQGKGLVRTNAVWLLLSTTQNWKKLQRKLPENVFLKYIMLFSLFNNKEKIFTENIFEVIFAKSCHYLFQSFSIFKEILIWFLDLHGTKWTKHLLVYFSNRSTEKNVLSTCIRNTGKFCLGEHKMSSSKFLYKEIGK